MGGICQGEGLLVLQYCISLVLWDIGYAGGGGGVDVCIFAKLVECIPSLRCPHIVYCNSI